MVYTENFFGIKVFYLFILETANEHE